MNTPNRIMECPKCGAIIQERASYCSQCGEVLNENPFQRLRVRSLLIWLLIGTILLSIVFAVVVFTMGDDFPFEEIDPVVFAIMGDVGFYGLTIAWGIWLLRKYKVKSVYLAGKVPSNFNWRPIIVLLLALIVFSIATVWITSYPWSVIAPEYTEYIFNQPFLLTGADTSNPVLYNIWVCFTVLILALVIEEFLFRGILFTRWSVKWGTTAVIIISSLLFGSLHLDIVGALMFGIMMCVLYMRTKTLWIPVVVHILCNMLVIGLEALAITGVWSIEINAHNLQTELYMALIFMLISSPIIFYLLVHWWPLKKEGPPFFTNSLHTQSLRSL